MKLLELIKIQMDDFHSKFFNHHPPFSWNNIYDDQNRLVSCCPNRQLNVFNLNKKDYWLVRIDWDVYLYDQKITFSDLTMETENSQNFIDHMNVQPEYSKEYWNNCQQEETKLLC